MEERFLVLRESGYGTVELMVDILQQNGYAIREIVEGMVPFCEGMDGQPVMIQGWSIVTEKSQLLEQENPAPSQGAGYTTPWLWK